MADEEDDRMSAEGDQRVEDVNDDDDIPLDEAAAEQEEDAIIEEQHQEVLRNELLSKDAPRKRSVEERVTTPYLTKYERARILGTRAMQIANNAPVLVPLEGEVDPLIIAAKELRQRVIPIIVRRRLPDNTYEDWSIRELEVDLDRVTDERYTNL